MFTLKEAALAHVKAAEKLLEPEAGFLNENEEVIPIFVNLLFQSVELTLKSFAIEAGLATEQEVRDKRKTRNGHGIEELAILINTKVGQNNVIDLLLPKRGFAISNSILNAMVFGMEFKPSRESYATRNITYGQFGAGQLQIFGGAKEWVEAVRCAAENIHSAAGTLNG